MSDDIIDLAAFRAAKIEKLKVAVNEKSTTTTAGIELRYEEGRGIVLDIEYEDFTQELAWTLEGAQRLGQSFLTIVGRARAYERSKDPAVIKAREDDRQRREKFHTVKTVGANGKKLPPLKVRGWALETLGGHTGPDAPGKWVRMTSARRTEIEARKLIARYVDHGYPPDKVRVVPVDHRGRVIPPERMPAA